MKTNLFKDGFSNKVKFEFSNNPRVIKYKMKELKTNRNFLNGKQYPYGFITWCWGVCKDLKLKDINHSTAFKQLELDSWLNYFMDGLSPEEAVKEDNKYQ